MALAPKPGILDIVPYKGGRTRVEGVRNVTKLSSNESPFGPSPLAIEAFHAAAQRLYQYPDGSAHDLRDAIDALMYGDLTRTDPRILGRYMGKSETEKFRRHHGV